MSIVCPEINIGIATEKNEIKAFIEQRSPQLLTEFFHFFKERPSKSFIFLPTNLTQPLPISITKITRMGVRPTGSSCWVVPTT